jgi:hypothetical protein
LYGCWTLRYYYRKLFGFPDDECANHIVIRVLYAIGG